MEVVLRGYNPQTGEILYLMDESHVTCDIKEAARFRDIAQAYEFTGLFRKLLVDGCFAVSFQTLK